MTTRTSTLYLALIYWAIFPVFYIDKTDLLGFEALPTFAPSKILRMIWLAVGSGMLITAAVKLTFNRTISTPTRTESIYLAYVVGAALSVIANTPRDLVAWYRVIELAAVVFACITTFRFFRDRYSLDAFGNIFLRAVQRLLFVLTIVIATTALIAPELAILTDGQGRNRLGGYLYSPNMLSLFLVLANIATVHLRRTRQFPRLRFVTCVIACHLGVVLTDSRTGLGLLLLSDLVIILTSPALHRFGRAGKATLFTLGAVAAGLILLLTAPGTEVITAIGHGPDPSQELMTLNNRLSVFILALEGIKEHPVLGVGFVKGVRGFIADNYTLSFWLPPHTHNGILEILLAQGSLGLPLVFILLRSAIRATISVYSTGRGQDKAIGLLFLIILAFSMTTVPFGNAVGPSTAITFYACLYLNDRIGRR